MSATRIRPLSKVLQRESDVPSSRPEAAATFDLINPGGLLLHCSPLWTLNVFRVFFNIESTDVGGVLYLMAQNV